MLTERINEWAVRKIVKSKLEDSIRGKQTEMIIKSENTTKDIVQKLTELIDTLNKDYDKSKEENKKLQAENTDLKDQNSSMNKELNDVIQENKELGKIIKELKTKNYELSMENSFVKKENNKLQDKLLDAAISHHKDKTEHAYIGLTKKYEELQNENKNIKETVKVVNSVVNNVEKQNKLLKNKAYSWYKKENKNKNSSKIAEVSR